MNYICDPAKNTECNKKGCGKWCTRTSCKEFAKDESGAKDKTPTLSESKSNIKNKEDERKEKTIHKGGPILSGQDMESTT